MWPAAITLLFLALHALLWAARPAGGIWLAASLLLFVLWLALFLWAVTRPTKLK
jgi:nitrogen fixation-related uncharacterized protein